MMVEWFKRDITEQPRAVTHLLLTNEERKKNLEFYKNCFIYSFVILYKVKTRFKMKGKYLLNHGFSMKQE